MSCSANTNWWERTQHLFSFTVGSHTPAQTSLNATVCWFWITPANIEHFVICVFPDLCNLSEEQEAKKKEMRRKAKKDEPATLPILFRPFSIVHGGVIVVGSFICCARTHRIGEFFKAQASRTCIRGQSGSSVMQRCGCYPRGLALLDMEMRVGGISQAL